MTRRLPLLLALALAGCFVEPYPVATVAVRLPASVGACAPAGPPPRSLAGCAAWVQLTVAGPAPGEPAAVAEAVPDGDDALLEVQVAPGPDRRLSVYAYRAEGDGLRPWALTPPQVLDLEAGEVRALDLTLDPAPTATITGLPDGATVSVVDRQAQVALPPVAVPADGLRVPAGRPLTLRADADGVVVDLDCPALADRAVVTASEGCPSG